jgi:hypothetical protein
MQPKKHTEGGDIRSSTSSLHAPTRYTLSGLYTASSNPQRKFILKMATEIFVETLKYLQHVTRIVPES